MKISVAEGYQPYVPQEWISSLGEVQWRQYEKLKLFSMKGLDVQNFDEAQASNAGKSVWYYV